MNYILQNHEPRNLLRFFEDICAIPHVSGDEQAISDYVVAFAKERGLFCYRDAVHNVFVRLPATPGYETAPAVMLQGHLDMVGEKDADSSHDFATDGLSLRIVQEGNTDWLTATGTTLGGDDGFAVALMLDLLDCPPEPHPALECLFTVSEETGLEGAWAFDPAAAGATARTMINLDSEAEGIVTAGCSGGVRTDLTIPVAYQPAAMDRVALSVALADFSGGHSGVEIHEGHTNAIKALARLLRVASCLSDGRLITLAGGGKDNAIPRDARALLSLTAADAECVRAAILAESEALRAEPNTIAADKAFSISVETEPIPPFSHMTAESHAAVLAAMELVRDGVLSMNAHVRELVAHSRNLGILALQKDVDGATASVTLSFSARSAVASHLDASEREMDTLAKTLTSVAKAPVTATHRARYPGWDYAPSSPLRDLWCKTSEALFGVTPRIEVIHAGLECGILCDKLPGMDIVSVGPAMRDIHTPRERLSLPSVERTRRLVFAVITELADRNA